MHIIFDSTFNIRGCGIKNLRQYQFLEILLNQTKACMAVLQGNELRYTLVSPAYQALCPDVTMLGRTYRKVFPEAAQAGVEALLRMVIETGESHEDHGFHAPMPGKPDAAWDHHITRLPLEEGAAPSLLLIIREVTDYKRAVAESRRARKDLDRAQEVGEIGSWRMDVRYNILTWSDENHRIFGLPKGTEMTYETFLGRVHPDDRDYVDEQWKAGLRGEPYDIEHRIIRDGEVRWVREKAYLEFDEAAKLLGGFGITQDITDRRRAADALRESERLYRSLFENMLNGFAYCRMLFKDGQPHDFIYLAVNEAFGTLTGLQNVVGRKVTEVVPGIRDTNPQIFEIYGRVSLTGRPERFETYIESLKMWFWISVYSPAQEHFVAVFDVITELKENARKLEKAHAELENRVQARTLELTSAVQQLSREIEERRQAEEELLKSKEMLQAVFDGISDPLVLLDRDMRVKLLNKSAADYFGVTDPRKIIGEFCYQAFKNEPHLCKGCKISLAFLKETGLDFERKGFRDPLREEKVFIYPVLKKGELSEIIYRINDITEKRLFEKRIIQNEKMASLGVLVSSIAHEINNPNAFIAFNIPILREYFEQLTSMVDSLDQIQPESEFFHMPYMEFRKDALNLIDNIEHGSQRISAFVSNLKEFSETRYPLKRNWVDLKIVVERAVSICRQKVKKAVKILTVDIPQNFQLIYTDPVALEHILINLLINASQAADKEDAWIRLSVARGRTWLEHTIIEVQDNGCGIHDKNLPQIFDPFYSTKPSTEGTGLGLYICHNLITGLGGRIEVETKLGEFTIFRILLPDMDRRKEIRI